MAEKLYFSYEEIHELVGVLSEKIKEFNPDVLVAIGGGGFIPARILRSYIHKPILAVGLELYDDVTNLPKEEPTKTQWFDEHSNAEQRLKGKRVLVVDEVDDTRTTLQYCVAELMKMYSPSAVGVMVLHNKLKPKRGKLPESVTYFTGKDLEDRWVVYPWDSLDIVTHTQLANSQKK
eukprot:TRINITY_DN6981_c0_g1_i1.p1 TRINITY_DN6981_c0_g1~~TRINITY_DN6981_c0_g1_i1.p1  ORF type:complete len:177 (+),score=49.82 TRINITY_DN6981_c0_g1_i1:97-627(+)